MAWLHGSLKFATKLLPNCFWGVRYVIELIGGPDRDRTDDLFHAMIPVNAQIIDGSVLTNRNNRQKRPNRRYLRATCGQNFNQVANGLVVWIQPNFRLQMSENI
jgi:hypothetical protein